MLRPKIAQLTSAHPRYDIRVFYKECVSLQKNGYDVSLIVADGNGNEIKDGVQFIDIGFRGNRKSRFLIMPWKMWQQARALKADIYHFHDPELLIIGMLLRLEGFKVIYDTHEDLPRQILSKYYIRPYLRKTISCLMELVENFVSKRLSAVVTATPHINLRFKKLNNNSVNVNNYPLLSEIDLSTKSENQRNPKQLCYTGGVTRIRGIIEIVKAIADLDIKLVMAGPMESDNLQKELEALPGWKKVQYLGTVSRKEVYNIMETSSLGLLLYHPEPNHTEAQPNKLFEYMGASLPVLASDFPLWRQIVVSNNAGMCVDPMSPVEIKKGIEIMLSSQEKINQMGQSANKAILSNFNWKNEENSLLSLYQEILGK